MNDLPVHPRGQLREVDIRGALVRRYGARGEVHAAVCEVQVEVARARVVYSVQELQTSPQCNVTHLGVLPEQAAVAQIWHAFGELRL